MGLFEKLPSSLKSYLKHVLNFGFAILASVGAISINNGQFENTSMLMVVFGAFAVGAGLRAVLAEPPERMSSHEDRASDEVSASRSA